VRVQHWRLLDSKDPRHQVRLARRELRTQPGRGKSHLTRIPFAAEDFDVFTSPILTPICGSCHCP
jgi:hypothetical protein